jgi:NAD(P)-dependent dehydrogenase (short-subunit alcohol dehydrogenase family)
MGAPVSDVHLGGQVALITGGANGIGAGVARRLADHGAHVVIADVDRPAGVALADQLDGLFVSCDVSVLADNQAAVAATVKRFGGLDLVHLNAGIATGCGVEGDFDVASYHRAMGINLDGVVFGAHAALPALRARGGGAIVATASMAGLVPVGDEPIYSANKHAVVGFVRSLGESLAGDAITVNALCPSFADTALIAPLRSLIEGGDFPILAVQDVVDVFFQILEGQATGECWFVVPGRPSEPFRFRHAPGPRV